MSFIDEDITLSEILFLIMKNNGLAVNTMGASDMCKKVDKSIDFEDYAKKIKRHKDPNKMGSPVNYMYVYASRCQNMRHIIELATNRHEMFVKLAWGFQSYIDRKYNMNPGAGTAGQTVSPAVDKLIEKLRAEFKLTGNVPSWITKHSIVDQIHDNK